MLKIINRTFDIFPVGILSEDGADHDFERSIAGPPVLRAEKPEHGVVVVHEFLGEIHFRLPRVL